MVTVNTEKLKNLAISENGFIFDPLSGYSYNVNETGLEILGLMKKGLSKSEIKTAFLQDYDMTAGHFESDYEHFLQMLLALDLVEEKDLKNGS